METKVIKPSKTKKNSILKDFIITKYGSISKFTKKEQVPRGDVEIILYKDDIFNEMNMGMKVCNALDIDVEELFCRGNIRIKTASQETGLNDINNKAYENMSAEEIIKAKCLKLGREEQRKILDFINSILEN